MATPWYQNWQPMSLDEFAQDRGYTSRGDEGNLSYYDAEGSRVQPGQLNTQYEDFLGNEGGFWNQASQKGLLKVADPGIDQFNENYGTNFGNVDDYYKWVYGEDGGQFVDTPQGRGFELANYTGGDVSNYWKNDPTGMKYKGEGSFLSNYLGPAMLTGIIGGAGLSALGGGGLFGGGVEAGLGDIGAWMPSAAEASAFSVPTGFAPGTASASLLGELGSAGAEGFLGMGGSGGSGLSGAGNSPLSGIMDAFKTGKDMWNSPLVKGARGLYNIYEQYNEMQRAKQMQEQFARMSDPFAGARGAALNRYQSVLNDPQAYFKGDMAQSIIDQMNRRAAAKNAQLGQTWSIDPATGNVRGSGQGFMDWSRDLQANMSKMWNEELQNRASEAKGFAPNMAASQSQLAAMQMRNQAQRDMIGGSLPLILQAGKALYDWL